MTTEALEAEVDRLRAELEAARQKELSDLRTSIAKLQHAVSHFRSEAERNTEIGRQIAAEAQREITELRAKLTAQERSATHARRFQRS